MIVETAALSRLRGQVTMVDGGFDPLHPGHVAYFREAAELGLPLLVNVSPDSWVGRKHRPLLTQQERAEVIDAIRWVTYTHLSAGTTLAILELLQPAIYAKGADWQGKLPQAELDACAAGGSRIVYLDTVLNSSSAILRRWEGQE